MLAFDETRCLSTETKTTDLHAISYVFYRHILKIISTIYEINDFALEKKKLSTLPLLGDIREMY